MKDLQSALVHLCQYDSKLKQAAYIGHEHAEAIYIVSAYGRQWKLCKACAALPEFAGVKELWWIRAGSILKR